MCIDFNLRSYESFYMDSCQSSWLRVWALEKWKWKKKSIQFYFTIYKLENVQKNKFLEFLLMRYFERFFNIDAEEKRRGIEKKRWIAKGISTNVKSLGNKNWTQEQKRANEQSSLHDNHYRLSLYYSQRLGWWSRWRRKSQFRDVQPAFGNNQVVHRYRLSGSAGSSHIIASQLHTL